MCILHVNVAQLAKLENPHGHRAASKIDFHFIFDCLVPRSAGLIRWHCRCVRSVSSYYFIYRHKCKFYQIKRQNECAQRNAAACIQAQLLERISYTSACVVSTRYGQACSAKPKKLYTRRNSQRFPHFSAFTAKLCSSFSSKGN